MEDDDLRRGHALRALAALLHFALHLRHAVATDTIERHDSCERHKSLLVESSTETLTPSTREVRRDPLRIQRQNSELGARPAPSGLALRGRTWHKVLVVAVSR